MQKHILTFTGLILIYLTALGCKENSALSSIPESNHHYNLDLDSAKQIILPDFLDSIRITKVISQEPILMKWFAGHILKASEDYLFLKHTTSNTIYGLDRKSFQVLWKLNLENGSPRILHCSAEVG